MRYIILAILFNSCMSLGQLKDNENPVWQPPASTYKNLKKTNFRFNRENNIEKSSFTNYLMINGFETEVFSAIQIDFVCKNSLMDSCPLSLPLPDLL